MTENFEFKDARLKADGAYSKITTLLRQYMAEHVGEKFDIDFMCRNLQIQERENRHYLSVAINREIEGGKLEKVSNSKTPLYIVLDNTLVNIPWYQYKNSEDTLDKIKWPCSHLDGSQFSFDGHVVLSPQDLVVFSGVSNMGKSTLATNFVWENMDNYPVRLMVNEYSPGKFNRKVSRMDWANPMKDDGTPKFEMIERHDNWKYAIDPDAINVIDWVNLPDGEFYKISGVMDGIRQKLNKGIAVVVLQKSENKDLGTGGQFSEHLASVYLNIDFERLTVRKVKEYTGMNPNGKVYGFGIVDGAHLENIREIKPCPKCHSRCLQTKIDCPDCHSKGYVDKSAPEY